MDDDDMIACQMRVFSPSLMFFGGHGNDPS